ncbi:MAG: ATP/GTP-binding protein [Gammaproteobacteria bacterium]|nr:ATP/GTP-binding protein [Gammaproteobacteria bacterium]|tara:strand:+ start:126099 stop:127793 length:1695 start_codon:yes stop_codon:yes gene_type:complete
MLDQSLKIRNYKCFREAAGFDEIKRVNLIIGRNNSGKSSLLDLVEVAVSKNYSFDKSTWRAANQPPEVLLGTKVTEQDILVFPDNQAGHGVPGTYRRWAAYLIGREIVVGFNESAVYAESIDEGAMHPPITSLPEFESQLAQRIPPIFQKFKFRRISAERDIKPEKNNDSLNITSSGDGVTNVIQSYLNSQILSSKLIETNMLMALNTIFSLEAKFDRITCQRNPETDKWEIFLDEAEKGRIALSKSGSGLKTIFIVLCNLILIPNMEGDSLSKFVFGFEELENNLHPSLLRKLNNYIYELAKQEDFCYFLTTHSNVSIDQFSREEEAQIIHVTSNNLLSETKTATTYLENHGILDDLDVRASDILQANGIIWVEGPSDRIYLNKWISLWSRNTLKEGTHYQVLFYGGRLLSHLSGDEPDLVEGSISVLNANRNAIILIDSDKRAPRGRINQTKRRIRDEFDQISSICWITAGKEIENYIPDNLIMQFWGDGAELNNELGQYDNFFKFVSDNFQGQDNHVSKKPLLAEKLTEIMTLENMGGVLDLDQRMNQVVDKIREWNNPEI